jgi:hypothetical protein
MLLDALLYCWEGSVGPRLKNVMIELDLPADENGQPYPGLSVERAARSPARPIRPIDLRARPIRVKRALTDRPW